MANRYSLDLRPRQQLPDAGDYLQQGIGSAIGFKDKQRQEENDIRARGGRPVEGQNPGIMGRLRGIGSTLKRNIFGDQAEATEGAEPTGGDYDTDDSMTRQQGFESPGSLVEPNRPHAPGIYADGRDSYMPGPGAISEDFGGYQPPAEGMSRQSEGTPFNDPTRRLQPTPPFAPTQGATPGPAYTPPAVGGGRIALPASQTGHPSPSIGSSLSPTMSPSTPGRRPQPYQVTGMGGQKYTMDPMYASNVALAGKEDEYGAAERHKQVEQDQQIQALVDAGMDPKVARAKVENNVVRYDETYGEGKRAGAALTYQQRVDLANKAAEKASALQSQRDVAAMQRARLMAAGQQNTAQFHQNELALQRLDIMLRASQAEAAGLAEEARSTEAKEPTGTNAAVQGALPGGAAQIAADRARAGALRTRADSVRKAGVDSVRAGLRGGNPPAPGSVDISSGRPKPTITQEAYDEGLRRGMTDAQIEARYNIPENIRRTVVVKPGGPRP